MDNQTQLSSKAAGAIAREVRAVLPLLKDGQIPNTSRGRRLTEALVWKAVLPKGLLVDQILDGVEAEFGKEYELPGRAALARSIVKAIDECVALLAPKQDETDKGKIETPKKRLILPS